jgi:hypothetical protein
MKFCYYDNSNEFNDYDNDDFTGSNIYDDIEDFLPDLELYLS